MLNAFICNTLRLLSFCLDKCNFPSVVRETGINPLFRRFGSKSFGFHGLSGAFDSCKSK